MEVSQIDFDKEPAGVEDFVTFTTQLQLIF
jgi:hypothetical protein